MSASSPVRFGVVGVGTMGASHARWLLENQVPRAKLTAVADSDPARLAPFASVSRFATASEMIRSREVDAVLIATPHFDHVTVAKEALAAGLHVLVEKPLAVTKADCQRLLEAYAKRPRPEQKFAVMFNLRTWHRWAKLKELMTSGELGAIRRINWIATDCFRTEAYYASGGWRATWKGEGGGVLVNQCPHHLDMLQWLFGMPTSVRAFCAFGKWHAIEVEDDVTAFMTYANGATGVFVASTGDAPGTSRLEITCERGKVVLEDDKLSWLRNAVPTSEFNRTTPERFARPETWKVEIPCPAGGGEHTRITTNFVDAILDGAQLLTPAEEGVKSAELANAMILSTLEDATIALPMDAAKYEARLAELQNRSTAAKAAAAGGARDDLAASFRR